MQSKRDKWWEIWNSDECKKYTNTLERVSFLFIKYSGAEIDEMGNYFIPSGVFNPVGLFNNLLNSRKSHTLAVLNALNLAGYKKELHSASKIDYGSNYITTLLSHLKKEIGDKEFVKGGDMEALLEIVDGQAGVKYEAVPTFGAPIVPLDIATCMTVLKEVNINPKDSLKTKLNEQINTFVKEITAEINQLNISQPPQIYAQINLRLNLLPALDINKLDELESTIKGINELGQQTHPNLDHQLGVSIDIHVQKITRTIEALRIYTQENTEQTLDGDEESNLKLGS